MITPPTHLALVVEDHLWPHLDSLAQWRDTLQHVTLVTTHGNEVRRGPAARLQQFMEKNLPGVRTQVTSPVNDDAPSELYAALNAVVGSGQWVVNASGVPSLMLLGAARFAQSRPDVPVLHREGEGPWYRLTDAPGGDPVNLGPLDRSALDEFRALDLVKVTWGDEERTVHATPARPSTHFVGAARRCVSGEHWESAFRQAQASTPRRLRIDDGFAFELFVMAIIRELGVDEDDIVLGAKLFHRRSLQEVDVIAQANGRLHLVDCKIGAKALNPVGMQIREAFATQEHLGDDAGRVMLLRPRMRVSEEMEALAREYDVVVVDAPVLEQRNLPDVLATFLGIPTHA